MCWLERKFPNAETRAAYNSIGRGLLLAVPRSGEGSARLIGQPGWNVLELPERDVSALIVSELLDSCLLCELTEHTENYRLGWAELRVPGDVYHIYAAIQ
jgi:hypothetical protein